MKINVGCGNKRFDGYIGVDAVPRSAANIVAPAHAIPLPDECAEEVMAIHLVEHNFEWEVPALLAEWFRLLKPGGLLVLELPDLLKACRNIADDVRSHKHPDQLGVFAIYGDYRLKDPLMTHKFGWWFNRLKPVVEAAGFEQVTEHETIYHKIGKKVRDFRLEAYKPVST